jgi:hypothetical protein
MTGGMSMVSWWCSVAMSEEGGAMVVMRVVRWRVVRWRVVMRTSG